MVKMKRLSALGPLLSFCMSVSRVECASSPRGCVEISPTNIARPSPPPPARRLATTPPPHTR